MNEEMAAPAQEQPQQAPEDQILDQIGALIQQLSPEKQAMLADQLMQMMNGGAQPADQGTVSPDAGPNGVPVTGV